MLNFIWGLLTGIIVSTIVCQIWLKGKKSAEVPEKIVYTNVDEAEKQENIAKIEAALVGMNKITNADVERICGVSDPTATRYLDELESRGLLRQISAGKDTYYEKV